jgi:hypothetical protein
MLRRLKKPITADLARRRDPHALEPSANREPAIQGEPNESSNLAGAGIVPNFGQHLAIRQVVEIASQHLAICQVVEIELLDEGANYRNFERLLRIHISLFSQITK